MSQLILNRFSNGVLDDLRKEMERLMGGLPGEDGSQSVSFAPRADLGETDEAYQISIDLPGVAADEVNIEFKDGHLWVTGERTLDHEEKEKSFHRVERTTGRFRRVFSFGNDVDAEKIDAHYADGVLSISLPKVEEVQPKRIEVKS